jgi:hypothetical protein
MAFREAVADGADAQPEREIGKGRDAAVGGLQNGLTQPARVAVQPAREGAGARNR